MLKYKLDKILFLDIETVPQTYDYRSLSDAERELWEVKFQQTKSRFDDDATAEYGYLNSAGIYAEFGKIVCISVGFLSVRDGKQIFRLKSFCGDDEKKLLDDFAQLLRRSYSGLENNLCGHNIKEFDAPYIARRMLINGLPLPEILDVAGEKPWNVHFLDTLELWRFGDYKNYTSLKLLTHVFGIPTPKDDIDGSQVAGVYYNDKDVKRIAVYCEKDVLATARLFLKMQGLPTIEDDNVEHVK
ncbi:MAG: 3'-5' exonuclease [Bacteroidales bacterium]|nr:3'-5' exonuclease [Bacteroidales bacterium]